MKVFCSECKHFSIDYLSSFERTDKCLYSENIKVYKEEDTWRAPGKIRRWHIQTPAEINANNNCTWYERLIK